MTRFIGRHHIGIGAGLILAVILVASTFLVWRDRQDSLREAQGASANVLTLLSRDLAANLNALDTTLKGIVQELGDDDLWQAVPHLRHRILFGHLTPAETGAGDILVINEYGGIIEDAASEIPRGGSFTDRDYFQIHRDRSDAGLHVSRPFKSRLDDGLHIALSRRVSHPDGSFAGVVVVGVPLTSLWHRLKDLNLAEKGSVTLFRGDGIVLVRKPYSEDDVGRDLSQTPNVQRYMREGSGDFDGVSAIDGTQRHYTFGHLEGLPMILSVSYAVDEVLASWRVGAAIQGAITLMLCALVVTLLVLFRRELELRRRAQGQLLRLARTDELTDLPNRRAFGEVYHREWRHAVRVQAPLSILYIDADYFKRFNDRYGHGQGDQLLREIGTVLKTQMRRPRDLAARYGGEEFVAVLPDTDRAGAEIVAEGIRRAIERLGVDHDDNPHGVATVSIGVAAARPGRASDEAGLLKVADEALYRAKAAGRNCVRGSEPAPPPLRVAATSDRPRKRPVVSIVR
ncbi:MAG: sensor domain-containing diguanylate cyclase, partial [Microvirga sp.]